MAYSRRYAHPNERQGDLMDSTVQNNSADLQAMINGLGLERVHLVDHSHAGIIATYFATLHAELLRSLALINAAVATMLLKEVTATAGLSLFLRSPRLALSALRNVRGTRAAIRAVEGGDRSAAERVFIDALQNGRTDLPAKPKASQRW
jgi:pimeloyl-ACP methyl ester carboxylesterase